MLQWQWKFLLLLALISCVRGQCCELMQAGVCVKCPSGMHLYRHNCLFDLPGCSEYLMGFDCQLCKQEYVLKDGSCFHKRIPAERYNSSNFIIYLQSALRPDSLLIMAQEKAEKDTQLWIDWYNYTLIHLNQTVLSRTGLARGVEQLRSKILGSPTHPLLHYIHTATLPLDSKIYNFYKFTYQLSQGHGFADLLVTIELVNATFNYLELSSLKVSELNGKDWVELSPKDIHLLYVQHFLEGIFAQMSNQSFLKGYSKKGVDTTNFTMFYMNSSKGVVTYNYEAENTELPPLPIPTTTTTQTTPTTTAASETKSSTKTSQETPTPPSPSPNPSPSTPTPSKETSQPSTPQPEPKKAQPSIENKTSTEAPTITNSTKQIVNPNSTANHSRLPLEEIAVQIAALSNDPIFITGYGVAIQQKHVPVKAKVEQLYYRENPRTYGIYFQDNSSKKLTYYKFAFRINENEFQIVSFTHSNSSLFPTTVSNTTNNSVSPKPAPSPKNSTSNHTNNVKNTTNTTHTANQTKNSTNATEGEKKPLPILEANVSGDCNKATEMSNVDITEKQGNDVFLPRINLLLRTMYSSALTNCEISEAKYSWKMTNSVITNITYHIRYQNLEKKTFYFEIQVANNEFHFLTLPPFLQEGSTSIEPETSHANQAQEINSTATKTDQINPTPANTSQSTNSSKTSSNDTNQTNQTNQTSQKGSPANQTNQKNQTNQTNQMSQPNKDSQPSQTSQANQSSQAKQNKPQQIKQTIPIDQASKTTSPAAQKEDKSSITTEVVSQVTNSPIQPTPLNDDKLNKSKQAVTDGKLEDNKIVPYDNRINTIFEQNTDNRNITRVVISPTTYNNEPRYRSIISVLKLMKRIPANATVGRMEEWYDAKYRGFLVILEMEIAVPLPDGCNLQLIIFELSVDPTFFVSCLTQRINNTIRADNKLTLLSSVLTFLPTTIPPSKIKQGPLSLQMQPFGQSVSPYFRDLLGIFFDHSPKLKNCKIKSVDWNKVGSQFGGQVSEYKQIISFESTQILVCFDVNYQVIQLNPLSSEGNKTEKVQILSYHTTNCSEAAANIFIYNLTELSFNETDKYNSKVNARLLDINDNHDVSIHKYEQYQSFYHIWFTGEGKGQQEIVIDSQLLIILIMKASSRLIYTPNANIQRPQLVRTLEHQISQHYGLLNQTVQIFSIRQRNTDSSVQLLEVSSLVSSYVGWVQGQYSVFDLQATYWHKSDSLQLYNFTALPQTNHPTIVLPSLLNWKYLTANQLKDVPSFKLFINKLKQLYTNFMLQTKIIAVYVSPETASVSAAFDASDLNATIKIVLSKQYTLTYFTNYLLTVSFNKSKNAFQIKTIDNLAAGSLKISHCLHSAELGNSLPACKECEPGYRLSQNFCFPQIPNCQQYFSHLCARCSRGHSLSRCLCQCEAQSDEREQMILGSINDYLLGQQQ